MLTIRRSQMETITASDENTLISYFHEVWPEKARYVGATGLRTLIGKSKEAAARYGIRHDAGQVEFSLHSFLFGHLFHSDPLYPWVDDILKSDRAMDSLERVRQLVDAFDVHLHAVLG